MTNLLEALSGETGIRALDLRRIMSGAPLRYKHYTIPKRGRGVRRIAQPAREVKLLQRALVKVLLTSLPVHRCATAYRVGLSIRDNANAHAGDGPILKLDLRNFFPSLKASDWVAYCNKTKCLTNTEEIHLTSCLLFHRRPGIRFLRLAIGAPSSPMLSNILMYDIDTRIFEAVAGNFVTYTRYADDMTFSAPRTGFLTGVMSKVAKIIRETRTPSLDINGDKTTFVTTKYHRTVTGLTLTNDGKVTIGREKKRKISAEVHYALNDKLNPADLQILAGMLAYVKAVEPTFLEWLQNKYGADIVRTIQGMVLLGTKLPRHDPPLAPIVGERQI